MANNIQQLLDSLTLFEKASLCSGFDFWTTKPIKRLNIPSTSMADGPHGLRKENNDDMDNVAMKASYPATAFPPAVNMASTWDTDLIHEVGVALGEQCLNQDVGVILGPGTNIKRSPLCGRNFEYFSEDPFLAGKMCIGYIDGVQSTGIGTSLKHFAVNSQEYLRMTINSVVDERSVRELYLTAFEMAVKVSQPSTVMCSYNRINGIYSSDNKWLLTEILRNEWGFKGLVVSDWNALNNRVAGIKAGMDLEMPSSGGRTDKEIVKAVVGGELLESELNTVVYRILDFIFKSNASRDSGYFYNYREGHKLARRVARDSMVLMKNNDNLLPINFHDEITVIGTLAKVPRYQGAGSSRINPYKLVSFTDYLDSHKLNYQFAAGYTLSNDGYDECLFNKAVEIAAQREKVIIFAGLTDSYESESYDRQHMDMPSSHVKLIEEISKINKNVIVVLFGGSPVTMPWLPNVKSVLNAYLPGEAGGEAIADIIYGIRNPSGKLAETYPISINDFIGSQYYKGGPRNVEHREGIYIGYRYYDTANKEVLFPFGHGLSYTTFKYSNLVIDNDEIKDTDVLKVSFNVTNIGSIDGAEVAQLYVTDKESTIFRPTKELKGFKKVFIKAGETANISLELDKRSFAYYNTDIADWHVESGDFDILIGASSRDIRLNGTVKVLSTADDVIPQDLRATIPTYYNMANAKSIPTEEFVNLYGKELPTNRRLSRGEFDMNTTVGTLKCCLVGKIFMKIAPSIIKGQMPNADMTTMLMLQQGMEEMPLRALNGVTSGLLDQMFMEGFLLWGNRHRTKGLFYIIKGLIMSLKNLGSQNSDRVKSEKKKIKDELHLLKEEQKQTMSEQRAMLTDLKANLDELKRLRKEVYNVDSSPTDALELIERHKAKVSQLESSIENLRDTNRDTLEDFRKKRKDDLKYVIEEEKEIKQALKMYMDTVETEDKLTNEEIICSTQQESKDRSEKKSSLNAIIDKLKKNTEDK